MHEEPLTRRREHAGNGNARTLPQLNYPLLVFLIICAACLVYAGYARMEIETDITDSLPASDPVIADARYIIAHHPIQDRLVVDVSHTGTNPEILVEGGTFVEKEMMASGLFESVGIGKGRKLFPDLAFYVIQLLPVMFSEDELGVQVAPLLESSTIRQKLEDSLESLVGMEGIGLSGFLSSDPLGLKGVILSRLSALSPSPNTTIYKGQLLSADRRHLLIIAKPLGSATETGFARKAMALFDDIARRLDDRYTTSDYRFVLTPTGAFRAALDNELTARKDVRFAVLATSLGIGALLILAFPRPYIGIASLLPAVFGTSIAFFAYSVIHEKISILTLGFGSAIVSITVDHGIAYLMFLDRPALTRGRDAAREVFAVSLFAAATTIGAFLALHLSGFKILAQTGLFAALGILFSFLFVHTLFPLLCPFTPPAQANRRSEAFLRFISAIATRGGKWKVCAAAILAVFLLFFARPKFETDIRAMNTVSNETQAAEQLVRKVWGNLFDKVFLLLDGRELDQLRLEGDRLVDMLEEDIRSGILNRAFASGMIFPGEARRAQNFLAWKRFWDSGRKVKLQENLKEIGRSLGFSDNAFRPFLDMIHRTDPPDVKIPGPLLELLGITNSRDGSTLMEFITATPGDHYEAERFFSRYSSTNTARVFDPVLFGERLGAFLARTFVRMAIIVSICTVFLLLIFFFDLTLALVSCVPILFAFSCTLGTLRLMGRPLGIPELMLSIVVMGMGVDYSLFFVRSYQRYYPSRPAMLNLVQGTVFLAAASTLIGFATLYFAQHRLLKQAGSSSFLGIFYCLLGVFALLPPILAHIYGASRPQNGTRKNLVARVSSRYRYRETLPRLVVPFKLKSASWLDEIAKLIDIPETVIDLSGAFGAYATALAELFPGVRVFAVEHDVNRARIVAGALGENGMVLQNLSEVNEVTDSALWVASATRMDAAGVMEQVRALSPKVRAGGTLVIVALDSRVRRLFKAWNRGWQRFHPESQPLKIEKALGELDFHVVEWRRTSGGDLLVVSTKR